ncbi:MAG TPA: hypothetical protein VIL49_14185 [Capillimicrobium sp.]
MTSRAALVALAAAALSLLLVAPAPSYDPWAWLLWGREVAHGTLSTAEGPAFKPLPVAACAALAPLGATVAPVAWLLLARWAAALGAVLAFGLARDVAGGSRAAGALAAAGVALTAGYASLAASGSSEGLLVALALGAIVAARGRRHRVALACAVGCALVRVEAWPFAAAYGLWLWRARPADRPPLALAAVAVPALWLVPELLGSGDLLRSGERARVPNPGQPALADVPAWAALRAAAGIALWPLWVALAALLALGARRRVPRAALALAAAGAAWVLLVAVMAQAGFSGEARYALPGVAVLAVAAAVVVARVPRVAAVGLVALAAVAAVPRVAELADVRAAQRHQADLVAGLRDAVRDSGGAGALLRRGEPVVGPLRGPMLAYALGIEKRRVAFVAPAGRPAVLFASRRTPTAPVEPVAPSAYRPLRRTPTWTILIRPPEYTAAPCPARPSPPASPCSPSGRAPAAARPSTPSTPATTSRPSRPPSPRAARSTSPSSRSPTA